MFQQRQETQGEEAARHGVREVRWGCCLLRRDLRGDRDFRDLLFVACDDGDVEQVGARIK